MKKTFGTLGFLLSFQIFANAIIISADRVPSELSTTSNEVIVLDRDELTNAKDSLLWKQLRGSPNINISNSGGEGQTTTISIRAADTRHTLVLLDNVELNDASTTGNLADLSQIGVSGIDSVEILPGSQSVLYGSDAMGGVLILKSKDLSRVKRPHFEYSGSYGSHNAFSTGLSHYNKINKTSYYIDASQLTTEGISQTSVGHNENSERDEHFLLSVTGKVEHQFNDNHQVTFLSRITSSTTDLDKGFGAARDDTNYDTDARNLLFYVESKNLFFQGLWEPIFTMSRAENKREDFDGIDSLSTTVSTFKSRFERIKVSNQNNFNLTLKDKFILGLEFEKETGQTESLSSGNLSGLAKTADENKSLYALYKRTDKVFWSTGFRYQNFENQDEVTFKLAPGFNFDSSRIWTSYSTGFKNPSLFQRNSSDYGNPNLKAERSKSFEIGLDYEHDKWLKFGITFFNLSIKNLIDTEGTYPNITYINIDKAESKGLSFNSETKYFGVNLTYQNTEDQNKNELINRPKLTRKVYAKYPIHYFEFYLENFYKGERDSGSTFSRSRERSFHLFNAKITLDYRETLLVWLNLYNLLDRDYTDVTGFNTDGLNFKIGFNWRY